MAIVGLVPASPDSGSRFDPERAAGLVRALLALAEVLDHAATVEIAAHRSTTADWAGFTRRWFEHQHHELVVQLRGAAASTRDEAFAVRTPPAGP